MWGVASTGIEYRVAVAVRADQLARARQAYTEAMIAAGRSVDQIEAGLDNLERRYGDGNSKNHRDR